MGLDQLLNFGALGIVLGFVLWQQDKRISQVERAINRMSKIHLLGLAVRPDLDDLVRREVREMLDEVESELKKGNGL